MHSKLKKVNKESYLPGNNGVQSTESLRMFCRNLSPPSPSAELCLLPASCSYFGLFDPEDRGNMFLQNVGLTFNTLQGVISQKMGLFITTAVRI
jgi:hypothetical protein